MTADHIISGKVLLATVFFVAGCMTIRNAREAQDEFENLGRDNRQRQVTNRIDLSDCPLSALVEFAMTNSPSVARQALAVKDARLALKQLRADAPLISETPWLSPRVSVSGGYSASSGSAKIDELTWKTEGSSYGSVSLSLPVFDFGRHDAKIRAKGEAVLDAELQLVNKGYEVFYDVASSYFTLLEKCALLSVAKTNELEFATHLEQAEERLKAGDAKLLDVTRARLDLAQAKEKVVSAQTDVDTVGAEFQCALGLDASYGTRREVCEFSGDPLTYVMRGFPDTDFTVDQLFALARTNSPTMKVVRSRLRAASADVDYAIADLMPEISASVSLGWSDPLWYWNWGVSAVQSVFQGFKKTTAVDRAVVAMCQAAKDVEANELALSLDLEKAVAVRDTARKAQETAEASMKEARENLELVRRQFQVGEATRVEYSAAVSAFTEAAGNRISAFYRKQCAEGALFALVGFYPVYEEKRLSEEMK